MKTINYQVQQIEVKTVNRIEGFLGISVPKDEEERLVGHDGVETLYRDVQGRYYLRRRLYTLHDDTDAEVPASGRTHVHRLSVKAAALWAIMRCNVHSTDLRRDVAASIKAEGQEVEPVLSRLRYPHQEPRSLVLHSLNVAKPEPVRTRETAAARNPQQGQPEKMRDGLLHLAADWRDEGARIGGRIANVLTRCAEALEAAMEGKEGR